MASAIEAATGLALTIQPASVVRLLTGGELSGVGLAVGRMAGYSLLSFGLACWPWKEAHRSALRAMLIYNALVTSYFVYLKFDGEFVGALLLPAIAVHSILTLLFARASLNHERGLDPS